MSFFGATTAGQRYRGPPQAHSSADAGTRKSQLWFGRHAERCDNIGRLLRVALNFLFNGRFD